MTTLMVTIDGYTFDVELDPLPEDPCCARVKVNGQEVLLELPDPERPPTELAWFIADNHPYEVMLDPQMKWVRSHWGIFPLEIDDLEAATARPPSGDGRIKAPIPGQITQVMVMEGDEVTPGRPLLVLEAMKMENEIRAPLAGRVKSVNVTPGQRIGLGDLLIEIEN